MATMTIKLIASDLDGTLLGPDHQLTARTLDILTQLSAAGYRIVTATGRGPHSAWPVIEPASHLLDMALTSNGAVVLDPSDQQVTHRFAMDPTTAAAMVEAVRTELDGVAFGWECASGFGWDAALAEHAPFLDEFAVLGYGHDAIPFDPNDQLTKVLVSHPTVVRRELLELVQGIAPRLVVTGSGVDFVEVSGTGIDKARGLRHLCEQWNIDASDVMAFGDNWNDMAMLSWAGHGVAMGATMPSPSISQPPCCKCALCSAGLAWPRCPSIGNRVAGPRCEHRAADELKNVDQTVVLELDVSDLHLHLPAVQPGRRHGAELVAEPRRVGVLKPDVAHLVGVLERNDLDAVPVLESDLPTLG